MPYTAQFYRLLDPSLLLFIMEAHYEIWSVKPSKPGFRYKIVRPGNLSRTWPVRYQWSALGAITYKTCAVC